MTDEHVSFLRAQRVFFVGTAPGAGGRVSISPKGYDTLRVIDAGTLLYLDFPGSGNETRQNVRRDGRLTFMWCSFDVRPLVLRAYCLGEVVDRPSARFDELWALHFPATEAGVTRSLIIGRIEAVQTSCGYGVPRMEYRGERPTLADWARRKRAEGALDAYIADNQGRSDEKFPVSDPTV